MATTRPTKTVNQSKRPHRELIKVDYDPRFRVPENDPQWFTEYMTQYSDRLERLIDRIQERIEQLEGHRGKPEIQADLSMLGNKIIDVADPSITAPQEAVNVNFLLQKALTLVDGKYVLKGDIDANGFLIGNLGNSRLAADALTKAEILALIASHFATATFTATGTGFTVNPTGTATYVRSGDLVILALPELTATSNAATFTVTGLPAAIAPAQASNHVVTITDGQGGGVGTDAYGLLQLAAGSTIITLVNPVTATGVWTTSGPKRLYSTTLAYLLV